MGVMRRNLLLTFVFAALVSAPVIAAVTLEESTDAEYLINSGYSQLTAEDVFMQKSRVNGKPIEPMYEKSQNKVISIAKKFYSYIDPSIDEPDRIHHDVKPSPSYSDL